MGYLNANEQVRTPHQFSDIGRLQATEHTDAIITIDEITRAIRTFKNNTPGETVINKIILSQLPESVLFVLRNIFNHSLSMGYFPNRFKTAIIKFIPKETSNSTYPTNYRLISLLEVTGKILEKTSILDLEKHWKQKTSLKTHNVDLETKGEQTQH